MDNYQSSPRYIPAIKDMLKIWPLKLLIHFLEQRHSCMHTRFQIRFQTRAQTCNHMHTTTDTPSRHVYTIVSLQV